jgi:hypothetical protein
MLLPTLETICGIEFHAQASTQHWSFLDLDETLMMGKICLQTQNLKFQFVLLLCGASSCNVFLLFFMALWVPISATLFRRAVLMLVHAFLFLVLSFFPLYFFSLVGLHCFFL